MAKLYVMCGTPGSGKSTYVRENMDEDFQVWVSRDIIRFALVREDQSYFSKEVLVYNTFIDSIVLNLKNGMDVYADATHLNQKSRAKLLNRIPRALYDEVEIIWVKNDLQTCIVQNEQRAGTRAYVPPAEVKKMFHSFYPPSLDEGFDVVRVVEKNRPDYVVTKNGEYYE